MSQARNLPLDQNHPSRVKVPPSQLASEVRTEGLLFSPEIKDFTEQFLENEGKQLKKGIITKKFKDKGVYKGELSTEGYRKGKGIFQFDGTQDVYFGDWHNDQFHGQGTYFFASGDVYRGELAEGMKHGLGTYTYKNGNEYSGEWKRDLKDGQGTFVHRRRNELFQGDFLF